jgi:hypothetical protein
MKSEAFEASAFAKPFQNELQWLSALLRASVGGLFLVAAINKLPGGIAGTVGFYSQLFENSALPGFIVRAHASSISFVELVLGAWLLSGYRLSWAWKVSALTLVSLALGMAFAQKYDVASDNYLYVAFAGVGLITSRYDRWVLGSETHPARPYSAASATE